MPVLGSETARDHRSISVGVDFDFHPVVVVLLNPFSSDRTFEKDRCFGRITCVPLHISPMGERMGYAKGMLSISEDVSDRVLRLLFTTNWRRWRLDSVVNEMLGFGAGRHATA